MKKYIVLLLVLALLSSLATPVNAAASDALDIPAPRYSYIGSLSKSLSIDASSCVATCYGRITASSYLPVVIVCEMQIYQGGEWSTLKTWTKTGTASISVSETYNVAYGNDYRVYVTGYVYDNNGNLLESASGSDAKYCPWPLRSID